MKYKCGHCKELFSENEVVIYQSNGKPTVDYYGELLPPQHKQIICANCIEKQMLLTVKENKNL